MPTDADWAWVAGIIEGEGWLGSKDGVVVVEMTDADVIEKLFYTTEGMGTLVGARPTNGTKPKYRWSVTQCTEVLALCTKIMPWLGNRRAAAARAVMARAAKKRPRKKYVKQNRARNTSGDAYVRAAPGLRSDAEAHAGA